ncbi:hypothetical protein RJT34_15940 [Clitoria ternatea]|uniref:EF-hand domain-containing protein n=1 Tax=Clitoria ternatea TaxID=43366 RepID=A0AAN9J9B4_CLITE
MFKTIDTDNISQITFEELKVGLKKYGANQNESEIYDLMQFADVDNSGTIDYGEFVAATLHLNKVDREDHLIAAFAYFDIDGSGFITPHELQQACEEFGLGDVHLEDLIEMSIRIITKGQVEGQSESRSTTIFLFFNLFTPPPPPPPPRLHSNQNFIAIQP